jgi:hypothetical protein
MAIIPINDLVELTTPADGDQLVIVDISEPADANKTKKISVLTLFADLVSAIAAKVGIYRRQGGNSVDWSSPGTTTYTPAAPRILVGVISLAVTNLVGGLYSGTVSITFPASFTGKPLIFVSLGNAPSTTRINASSYSITPTGCGILVQCDLSVNPIYVHWIAIGE